jgi:hypothetical protein
MKLQLKLVCNAKRKKQIVKKKNVNKKKNKRSSPTLGDYVYDVLEVELALVVVKDRKLKMRNLRKNMISLCLVRQQDKSTYMVMLFLA